MFQDCCNASTTTSDTMGSVGEAAQLSMLTSFLTLVPLIPPQCATGDLQTGAERQSGYCHYIGDYCADNWPLAGCVQQAHAYCCFDSMLARIIQEAGRSQLTEMGGFGTADAPNCRGFTTAEFQSIDFSKVDLSSYYTELVHSSQTQFQGAFQNATLPAGP
jgi:hypothetical protein